MNYTESFKAKMVQRMAAPNAVSAISLSKEVGVSQSQLSRWLRAACNVILHAEGPISERVVKTIGTARSASEKVRLVMAAAVTTLVCCKSSDIRVSCIGLDYAFGMHLGLDGAGPSASTSVGFPRMCLFLWD